MSKKIKVTKRSIVLTAVVGAVILVIMVIGNTFWSTRRTIIATNEAVSTISSFYLDAMADRRAKTITNMINNTFDQMNMALKIIQEEGVKNQDELRESIGRIASLLSLSSFALVDEDNVVYTQYTTYTGGTRHNFLSEDKLKDRVVSTVYLYDSSKQLCLAIPTPGLELMGKEFKACFVQIDVQEIVKLLAFDDPGRTYFGLFSVKGSNLSNTGLGFEVMKMNILDVTRDVMEQDAWEKLRDDFENLRSGNATFELNGNTETICYVPIQDTDWQMVVLIRESVITDRIRGISENNLTMSRKQILFTLFAVLVYAAILLLQIRQLSKEELNVEKAKSSRFFDMANTDSLTGVSNKHAFSGAEASIDKKIRDCSIEKLAIIVGDVNGLKIVNDTKGHAAGDKLIKDAAVLLSEYFSEGIIYRIGGDEFAIVVQEKGYDSLNEVIERFNRKVEENIGADEVVISIGSSVLEVGDKKFRDVFERADKLMYERKKELKSMGAKTR